VFFGNKEQLGKPHLEQGQIEIFIMFSALNLGRPLETHGDVSSRWMITTNRTRLMSQLNPL